MAIEVSAGNLSGNSWKATKVKDGSLLKAHLFGLESVNVGQDEDNDPITSCAVRWNQAADALNQAQTGGGNQKEALVALKDALKLAPFNLPGAPMDVRAMTYADAQRVVAERLKARGKDRPKERSKEAIDGLKTRGVINTAAGGLQPHKAVLWLA